MRPTGKNPPTYNVQKSRVHSIYTLYIRQYIYFIYSRVRYTQYLHLYTQHIYSIGMSEILKVDFFCAVTILLVKILRRNIGKKSPNTCTKWVKINKKLRKKKKKIEFSSLYIQISNCCTKSAKFCAIAQR